MENDRLCKSKELLEIDYLTQLSSRKGIIEYYNRLGKAQIVHIICVDIDDFKRINEIYGYSVGDRVIVSVSEAIRRNFPKGQLSRIGGDQFLGIIDGSMGEKYTVDASHKLIDDVRNLKNRKDIFSGITLNIGLVLAQNTDQSFDDILAKCDHAVYQAKAMGKSRCVVYKGTEAEAGMNKTIELEMKDALNDHQFVVYLQPKVNGVSNRLEGAEALVRWNHPVDGLRPPGQFIPLFEKNGFIARLDIYVFEEVCRMKERLKGTAYEKLVISVNMSRIHLFHSHFPDILKQIADEHNVPSEQLEIEITESVFIRDRMELIDIVNEFRKKGFHVSIDDFGSGYSALNMLKDIPADTVKIDREFLQMSVDNDRGKKVLKNVINMCKDLKMEVVTEGVETKEESEAVIGCGCQIIQGYYYAKPMNFYDFTKFAEELRENFCDEVEFTFDGKLTSTGDKYTAVYARREEPADYSYREGIFENTQAIHLPGGLKECNCLILPYKLISTDSFTVAVWVRPETLCKWTSIFYIKYETGFIGMVEENQDGVADMRVRDSKEVDGWYDVEAAELQEGKWSHMAMSYDAVTETGKIYVNGKCMGRLSGIPTLRYAKLIYAGGDVFQNSYKGDLCHLKIYSRVKKENEIEELYRAYVDKQEFAAM